MDKIPIIDFAPLLNENWDSTATEVRDALHEIGFMYIVNHGIPQEAIDGAFEGSSAFFSLDQSLKLRYKKRPGITNSGWTQAGQELLSPNSIFELRESFDYDGPLEMPEAPDFSPKMERLKKECSSFMRSPLLPLLSSSLGLPPQFFNSTSTHLENASVGNECDLRAIYYPALPETVQGIPKESVRCAEHTDYELATLLFQDDVGGLQVRVREKMGIGVKLCGKKVKNSEGKWIDAEPIKGAILLNTGDLLENWTAGFYPATKHRVKIPEKELQKKLPRYSFAYFFAPDNSTLVSPLRESKIIQGFGGMDYEPITAYEHIMKRVKAAYQY